MRPHDVATLGFPSKKLWNCSAVSHSSITIEFAVPGDEPMMEHASTLRGFSDLL